MALVVNLVDGLMLPIKSSQIESHQCHKRGKKKYTLTPIKNMRVQVLNTIVREKTSMCK